VGAVFFSTFNDEVLRIRVGAGWDSINFQFQGAMSVISVVEAGLFAREPICKGGSIWNDKNVMRCMI